MRLAGIDFQGPIGIAACDMGVRGRGVQDRPKKIFVPSQSDRLENMLEVGNALVLHYNAKYCLNKLAATILSFFNRIHNEEKVSHHVATVYLCSYIEF